MQQGTWDILRGAAPFVDDRRGIEFGGGFNNHNVEKLGITHQPAHRAGQASCCATLVAISDVVTENFAAGVLARLGFPYDELRAIKPDIVYVSNCGFGHAGPVLVVQDVGPDRAGRVPGSRSAPGCPTSRPPGWGYSYMDHMGANFMAVAILAGLIHRNRTGEGQWIDMACTEAGTTLVGPDLLDYTVNGRPLRRDGQPDSQPQPRARRWRRTASTRRDGDDNWVAIACRDDDDWTRAGRA